MAKQKYTTTRIWSQTLHRVRLIAAMTNKSIVGIIDELVERELRSVVKHEGGSLAGMFKANEVDPISLPSLPLSESSSLPASAGVYFVIANSEAEAIERLAAQNGRSFTKQVEYLLLTHPDVIRDVGPDFARVLSGAYEQRE